MWFLKYAGFIYGSKRLMKVLDKADRLCGKECEVWQYSFVTKKLVRIGWGL